MPADNNGMLPMGHRGTSLVDVLDRILDKGLVVAGDIKVSLADVELLTIRIRLVICSVDKAEAIGMDWWRSDPNFSSAAHARTQLGTVPQPATIAAAPATAVETKLESKLRELDDKLNALMKHIAPPGGPKPEQTPGAGTG